MKKSIHLHLFFTFSLFAVVLLFGTGQSMAQDKDYAEQIGLYEKEALVSSSGLKYVVLSQGHGDKPSKGQTVETEYTGRFLDGEIFDSSVGRRPFAFKVGLGQVIKGWDEALLDMKVGEKRALIVPPDLAYGRQGAGGLIPPGATLFFEVEHLK